MSRTIAILLVGLLMAGSALASDESDILAVINQWNDPDEAKQVAACTADAFVVDDFPPYVWSGPNACGQWARDYDASRQKIGMTNAGGTVGKPQRLLISPNRAYAVVPTTFAYTRQGKVVNSTATVTFVLHKTKAGWRIFSWTWATQTVD
jgi:ketosteroid isomerase-like protein